MRVPRLSRSQKEREILCALVQNEKLPQADARNLWSHVLVEHRRVFDPHRVLSGQVQTVRTAGPRQRRRRRRRQF